MTIHTQSLLFPMTWYGEELQEFNLTTPVLSVVVFLRQNQRRTDIEFRNRKNNQPTKKKPGLLS